MQKHFFGLVTIFLLSACSNNDKKSTPADVVAKDSVSATKTDSVSAASPAEEVVVDTAKTVIPPEGISLQLNLAKGKTYSQTMDLNAEQEGGKMSTGINWAYDMNVQDDNGKTKTLNITYRRIAMSMNMGGQKMEISSDSKMESSPDNPLGMMVAIFRAMNGKSFQMEVGKDGDVKTVKGFDAIANAVADEMKIPGEKREQMLQAFKSQFNDGMVRDMFAQSFNIYPVKKVKAGDSWEKKTNTAMGKNAMATTTTYLVKSIKGNRVELVSRAKLSLGSEQVTSQGTYVVDARNGLVLSGDLQQNLGGNKGVSRIKLKGREM